MAKVIQAKDWSATALGPIEAWSQSLRTIVNLAQASNFPIALAWGAGHTQIYNDGYWPICGAKHPSSMGQDFRECWASAWPQIGEAYASAWSGRSAYLETVRTFIDRYGFLEETWFTFSFSPVTDESGGVGGVFHPVFEMTRPMLSERRIRILRDLAIGGGKARTSEEAVALSMQVLREAELPEIAFVLPTAWLGHDLPAAVLVAGASSRLPMNEAYRGFYDLVAGAIGTTLGGARAYEEARLKAEALAQIDRAKTAFFSNVSHEFRTPLTLILGTTEAACRRSPMRSSPKNFSRRCTGTPCAS